MFTLERLESALLARWGREEMTVYADYLQSIGDPRGEAIAIDLVNLDTVDESAWRTRRHDALTAWLGEDLATKFGGNIFQGFVQEASADEALLASPAGDFVRASRFSTTDRKVYEHFVERPRPWLTHLSISIPEPGLVIDDALADELVATTPRLDQLVLRGTAIARRFVHPTVRHIRIEGAAVGSLGWGGDSVRPPGPTFAIERVHSPVAGTRLYVGPTADTLRIVDDPAIRKHVTHLRYAGVDLRPLLRALAALSRVSVLELVVHDFRAEIAKRYPDVEIVTVDR